MNPLQVLVADTRGLDVRSLIHAIEHEYVSPTSGRRVRVKLGHGVVIDGVPPGTLRLVDR